ncbi:MAG: hypothetical protein WDM81_21250 [Rhizomicrobium sp.]
MLLGTKENPALPMELPGPNTTRLPISAWVMVQLGPMVQLSPISTPLPITTLGPMAQSAPIFAWARISPPCAIWVPVPMRALGCTGRTGCRPSVSDGAG